ncbi:3599_t:CDS:2, partial [Cetraspora pellucida]
KTKLNKLQQDLLQYYKEIINHTNVSSQLREIQLAIERETRLFAEQKVTLFDLVNEKYQKNIQQEIINNINEKINKESNIVKLQVDIKDEINDNNNLTFQQKCELHNIHNEKIRNFHRNTELTRFQEEIKNESFLDKVRQEYLKDERTQDKLDQVRRSRLDFLNIKNENQIYNSLLIEIQQSKDIERLKDDDQTRRPLLDSLYDSDGNQSYDLLLELIHNNLVLLKNTRKQNYNDGLYNILKSAIENENSIDKLKTIWLQAINKIEYEYLTNERTKSILQELLNKRIQYLQQLEEVPKCLQTKHSIEEVESNSPTTNPNKADQEYQRKYFPRTKTKTVSEIIKKAYNTIRDKRSLLDVLYYKWFSVEKIDVIVSIKVIIDQYKNSLANILDITQKNIDIIQQSLSDMMLDYKTENEKKNFLDVVTEVLINDEEIEYIKEEIKNMFNLFDFNF